MLVQSVVASYLPLHRLPTQNMFSDKVGVSTNKSTSTSTARPGPAREIKHTPGAARNYYKQVNWMPPFFLLHTSLATTELTNLSTAARKRLGERKRKKENRRSEAPFRWFHFSAAQCRSNKWWGAEGRARNTSFPPFSLLFLLFWFDRIVIFSFSCENLSRHQFLAENPHIPARHHSFIFSIHPTPEAQ